MAKSAFELVDETIAGVSALDVPEELQKSILKHQANLLGLANALLAAGKSEAEIRNTLDTLFSSYKDDLARTIVAIRDNQ